MKSLNEEPEEIKKYIERKAAETIIKKYLAVKKISNSKIRKMELLKCEGLYNALRPDLREECESKIIKDIEEGKLDLETCLPKSKAIENDREER